MEAPSAVCEGLQEPVLRGRGRCARSFRRRRRHRSQGVLRQQGQVRLQVQIDARAHKRPSSPPVQAHQSNIVHPDLLNPSRPHANTQPHGRTAHPAGQRRRRDAAREVEAPRQRRTGAAARPHGRGRGASGGGGAARGASKGRSRWRRAGCLAPRLVLGFV